MSDRLRSPLVAAAVLLVVLLPLWPIVLWSVAARWFHPSLWPQALGLRGFRELVASGVLDAALQSTGVAMATVAVCMLLAYPAGRALGLYAFRGRGLVRLVVLAPALLPSMTTALGLHARFIQLGLADTVPGVVLAHIVPALPYAVSALAATFAGYDSRYEQASRNLGASAWATFCRVTLPLVAPGLVVAALFAFLISWSQYTLTLVVGGGVVVTLPLLLYSLASSGDLHLTAAACVLFLIPVLALLPVSSRALTGASLGGRG